LADFHARAIEFTSICRLNTLTDKFPHFICHSSHCFRSILILGHTFPIVVAPRIGSLLADTILTGGSRGQKEKENEGQGEKTTEGIEPW
jgi:hypothetical protein